MGSYGHLGFSWTLLKQTLGEQGRFSLRVGRLLLQRDEPGDLSVLGFKLVVDDSLPDGKMIVRGRTRPSFNVLEEGMID